MGLGLGVPNGDSPVTNGAPVATLRNECCVVDRAMNPPAPGGLPSSALAEVGRPARSGLAGDCKFMLIDGASVEGNMEPVAPVMGPIPAAAPAVNGDAEPITRAASIASMREVSLSPYELDTSFKMSLRPSAVMRRSRYGTLDRSAAGAAGGNNRRKHNSDTRQRLAVMM